MDPAVIRRTIQRHMNPTRPSTAKRALAHGSSSAVDRPLGQALATLLYQ